MKSLQRKCTKRGWSGYAAEKRGIRCSSHERLSTNIHDAMIGKLWRYNLKRLDVAIRMSWNPFSDAPSQYDTQ
jgi:hypothetical protein